MDWLGFDEITNIKFEQHLKYDEIIEMNNIIDNNIYETGESFCDFTIKLSENQRIETRTYTKLVTILGDVGGLMEVIFTIFRIISSFSVDILYEISLVNTLFNFDLNKKKVILKDKKSEKINSNNKNNKDFESKINELAINFRNSLNSNYLYNDNNENTGTGSRFVGTGSRDIETGSRFTETGSRFSEENHHKNKIHNDNNGIVLVAKEKRRKNRIRPKSKFLQLTHNINNTNDAKYNKKGGNKIDNRINRINTNITNNEDDIRKKDQNIIRKIKINRACIYLCSCCVRRGKKINNCLLDEGMRIISEKMDIFNIFDKMYKYEDLTEKVVVNKSIEMSDKCIIKLQYTNFK